MRVHVSLPAWPAHVCLRVFYRFSVHLVTLHTRQKEEKRGCCSPLPHLTDPPPPSLPRTWSQMGRGRTTTGTIIASLLFLRRMGAFPRKKNTSNAGTKSGEAAVA